MKSQDIIAAFLAGCPPPPPAPFCTSILIATHALPVDRGSFFCDYPSIYNDGPAKIAVMHHRSHDRIALPVLAPRDHHTFTFSAPSIYARVLEHSALGPGMRLLCVGSGTGYFCAIAAQLVSTAAFPLHSQPAPVAQLPLLLLLHHHHCFSSRFLNAIRALPLSFTTLLTTQVGVCGTVHGVELHASNVAFARDATKRCVCVPAGRCVLKLTLCNRTITHARAVAAIEQRVFHAAFSCTPLTDADARGAGTLSSACSSAARMKPPQLPYSYAATRLI